MNKQTEEKQTDKPNELNALFLYLVLGVIL